MSSAKYSSSLFKFSTSISSYGLCSLMEVKFSRFRWCPTTSTVNALIREEDRSTIAKMGSYWTFWLYPYVFYTCWSSFSYNVSSVRVWEATVLANIVLSTHCILHRNCIIIEATKNCCVYGAIVPSTCGNEFWMQAIMVSSYLSGSFLSPYWNSGCSFRTWNIWLCLVN